jgi:hypothetical protein
MSSYGFKKDLARAGGGVAETLLLAGGLALGAVWALPPAIVGRIVPRWRVAVRGWGWGGKFVACFLYSLAFLTAWMLLAVGR